MRRALLAVALGSAALVATAAFGSGGATGFDDARCEFDARADGGAIAFRVSCNFEPNTLKLRPSTGVRRVSAMAEVKPPTLGDPFDCERQLGGKVLRCFGHMEDGATAKARFRPRGEVCETSIPYGVGGGVDCDGGEACIDIALGASGEVRRPRGC